MQLDFVVIRKFLERRSVVVLLGRRSVFRGCSEGNRRFPNADAADSLLRGLAAQAQECLAERGGLYSSMCVALIASQTYIARLDPARSEIVQASALNRFGFGRACLVATGG